jgi:uncharacterized protein YeaO (DUF488 family)
MPVHVVRLGSARKPGEGTRIGTVRRPPRGVKREEYASDDYFDVWLPELAPSAPLVSRALSEPWTPARWKKFARAYRREMQSPQARHLVALLAALSTSADLSVGCYCEDATHCHRSLLAELLRDAGAVMSTDNPQPVS